VSDEPNTSVNWNGVKFTGYASKGKQFGEAEGETPDAARDAAVAALGKSPERTPPAADAAGPVPPPPK
jgi:hypothetical protein